MKHLLRLASTFIAAFSIFSILAGTSPFMGKPAVAATSVPQIFKQYQGEFDRCYEADLLRSKKKIAGRINLRIMIDGTGKVVEAGPTKNTTQSRFLADCLVRVVERISFGKQKKKSTKIVRAFHFPPKPRRP